jgi:hypothetical protein
MPHTGVALNRFTRRDLDLQTNVRRVYGVHAYCACGWIGETRDTWSAAQHDAKLHRGKHKLEARGL